jgi:hypothetical protein
MTSPQRPPLRPQRPKQKTPAERAEEFAGEQQRMKREAAERREAKAKAAPAKKR